MSDIINTLTDRGQDYGCFKTQSEFISSLKTIIHNHGHWATLEPYKQESLDMIMVKISRIMNGNSNKADSWHDISGYAKLVEEILNGVNH